MSDPTPDTEQAKSDQSLPPSPVAGDVGKLTKDGTIHQEGDGQPGEHVAKELSAPRRFRDYLPTVYSWWESLKSPDVSNRIIAVATVVIAVATAFTYWEVHSGSSQTDAIISADQRIATAMEGALGQAKMAMDTSNEQSRTSLNAAIDQSHLEQRAWVGIVSMDPPDLRPKPDFSLVLHVINSGHTPALEFEDLVILHSLKKGEPFRPIYGNAVGAKSLTVVQPGEVFPILTNQYPIDQAQIDAVKSGELILYVYGKMSYKDVFKQAHHTTFCKIVVSNSLVEDCSGYNTAD